MADIDLNEMKEKAYMISRKIETSTMPPNFIKMNLNKKIENPAEIN